MFQSIVAMAPGGHKWHDEGRIAVRTPAGPPPAWSLIAILLPNLGNAREKAKRVQCGGGVGITQNVAKAILKAAPAKVLEGRQGISVRAV